MKVKKHIKKRKNGASVTKAHNRKDNTKSKKKKYIPVVEPDYTQRLHNSNNLQNKNIYTGDNKTQNSF